MAAGHEPDFWALTRGSLNRYKEITPSFARKPAWHTRVAQLEVALAEYEAQVAAEAERLGSDDARRRWDETIIALADAIKAVLDIDHEQLSVLVLALSSSRAQEAVDYV